MKKSDPAFAGFGEAYFTWVEAGAIKAWKMHLKMKLNLVVPVGEVLFVFYDSENKTFINQRIVESNYKRIAVPPNIWFGFQGLSTCPSLILNLANHEHDPAEMKRRPLNEINYHWDKEPT